MSDYVCEPLGKQHDRTQFDCGAPVLNEYLAKYANQDVKRRAAAVIVLMARANPRRVVGYYTLSAISVELSSLPPGQVKRLPRYPQVPAILIGRMARDVGFLGTGELLLADALERCVHVSSVIAASLIVVDSKGEAATRFYRKFGFLSLPKLADRMFLSMRTAETLF